MARNAFYKDGTHRLFIGFLLSLMVNIIALTSIIYIYTHPPAPVYFATSTYGRITPIIPLDQPNSSDAVVLQWASLATIGAFSYNFVNYRSELEAASEFFTANGWNAFLKTLKDSNNLLAVVQKKLVVTAVPTRTPEIIKKGVIDGRYAWQIKIPIQVSYISSEVYSTSIQEVTLLITRLSALNNPKGIGIEQFVSNTIDQNEVTQ
ncbi:MAG: type IV secretion protein DotI [Gammaproteobacteria bacterium]|nr:type IV secretion protein DotI [Gammaproteobacteria bacterium]